MTPPAARQPGSGVDADLDRLMSRLPNDLDSALLTDIHWLIEYVRKEPLRLAAEYQRGVEEVLALLNPRQHAIMTFDELRQQARALIPGEGVQR